MKVSLFTTGVYLDMAISSAGPIVPKVEVDEVTVVHVALDDCGFYVRWLFENPEEADGRDLEVAIEHVHYDDLAKAFERVTGRKARFVDVDFETYWREGSLAKTADRPRGFGSAERDLESARHDAENAQRAVDDLDREIDWANRRIDDEPWYNCPPLIAEKAGLLAAQATATAGLQVVRGVFFAAEALVHGTGFVAAEGAIGAAEVALDSVRDLKTAALNTAKDALEEVNEAQRSLIQDAIDALHAAQTASEELHVFDLARDALGAGESIAQGMINGAQEAVDGLSKCGEFIAFDASEAALRFAQSNTSELNLARDAVEVAEGAVNMGLDMGKWAMQHAGQVFNIRKMEFSGSTKSLVAADASTPPLVMNIEGTVLGEDFQVHIQWKPHFNLVELIKELFTMIWEKIKELAKHLIM
ncbi:hypothetical protein CEP54_007216 [Fusarium duplospermum]|uniref:NmrA-like domain-containing protein n=1 Tax=Fusarium duplospermum TaxID=1325734 RepID=A0A428Q2M1_9HYPO|nr:hypothetical protein CEP54_007216 [Fusarium duplospermum]